MSVALFDLRCPSYDYVKRMSWGEFLLRINGFQREDERQQLLFRELAWASYVAPHSDPKKMKKTKQAFWPIGKKKTVDRSRLIDRMRVAQEEYLKNAKNG